MKTLTILISTMYLLSPSAALGAKLPDPNLTPGVVRHDMTLKQMCATKWGHDHRAVTEAMKKHVFAEYGLSGNDDKFCKPDGCEIDHLVSRELLGADDVKNLWPQSYSGDWNAHMKDRVENKLHVEVCAGRMKLEDAQGALRTDWTKAYVKYFGNP